MSTGNKKKRLCVVVTSALSLKLFRKQWLYWQEQGWDVTCIAGPGDKEHEKIRELGVSSYTIPIVRNPSIFKDLFTLVYLWCFLLWHRFDILHISTPKASFISSIAARLSGHNKIYYLLRGRAYENMVGLKRKIMMTCEWITCHLSTVVVPICSEMGEVIINEGLCSKHKIKYVGSGSSAGIDLDIYSGRKNYLSERHQIRREYGIDKDDIVLIYAGWFRKEKGTNELVKAFSVLEKKYNHIKLMLLGDYENTDPLSPDVLKEILENNNIIVVNWVAKPAAYYAASDIMVFPSYREGFGNVAIEASAMNLPVAASDIMGCREAVVDGKTGILFQSKSVEAISKVLEMLIDDASLRSQLGNNGRIRAVSDFGCSTIFEKTDHIIANM